MEKLKDDLKRLPYLLSGLFILGIGIFLTKLSFMGMAPWGVFHVGLSFLTNIPFGMITQIIGIFVLILSTLFFKVEIGIGTILNVALVGPLIDLLDFLFPFSPKNYINQFIIFSIGFFLMNIGRSLYISSCLGQGPRDGLFIGVANFLNWNVKIVKPMIDFTVFVIGFLLLFDSGLMFRYIGIGTFIIVFFSGYVINYCFKVLHFHPSMAKGYSIKRYIQS